MSALSHDGSSVPAVDASGSEGLSAAEATRRLVEHGRNELPVDPGPSVAARVLHQLTDPMILLLCAALVLVVAVGDTSDAAIIAAVVVLNTTVGVVQEVRAQRAVDALSRMAAPVAHVWRDGRLLALAASDVVPGDVVRLEAGDVVPADLAVLEARDLEVDESAMTGESLPVRRDPAEEILAGTVVTRGRGVGRVVRTGTASALGQIAALVGGRVRPTPLQRRLAVLSRQLVVVTGALCLVVLALALAQGESWPRAAVLAVSLGVAAVPESLPAVVTISLALGAHRMARRHAVVRRLPAVETLGSVTVVASDKTGTLTPGVLTVRRLWTPEGPCEVSGTAYGRAGAVTGSGSAVSGATRLLRDAALCNDATLVAGAHDDWQPVGDPFDVALLVAAAKVGATSETLGGWTRVDETPFDSALGWARTVHRAADGTRLEVVKGAPETVLALLPAGPVADRAAAEARRLAAEGHRVLAVAEDRAWAGLVAVIDPPHPAAATVVEQCREAGIRTVLVTGDHPATASAIAAQVGILGTGRVVEGAAVARGEHLDRVEEIDVYARIRPEQKVSIVEAWQAYGAVVAMTGDGVNDAPALRRADIGVAMGGRGTEVARQAADLVLVDDDLGTLVVAVAEGRRIHANIRTFLRYGLAGGVAEVAVLLIAPLAGLGIPLTPAMILWVNMLTHGLPGVAFGGEPLDPATMRRPSPAPDRSILDRVLVGQIAFAGALVTATSLAAAWWASWAGSDVRTAVFLTLGLGQLFVALALRAPRTPRTWRWNERGLELAVLCAAALQVGGAALPGLAGLLGTEPPRVAELLWLVLLAVLPGVLVRLTRAHPGSGPESRPTPVR
ncbi:cation-translocating P-type ATPase [Nocardioides halotolerans]|uniref:cation-translocating P-type ATPase n=1 Tax=Nocardioides halotolerans TaxID=433660 RepID=UPI0004035E1F|nr:cation-transporting P-type ATPase [Nocardioides halotolerans]